MRYAVENLDDYRTNQVVDRGEYRVLIEKMEARVSKNGGPMSGIELTITDGPDQENGSSPLGRKIFYNLIFPHRSHKDGGASAGGRVKQFCQAFGIPYDATGFDDEDAIGKEALAIVAHREYEGDIQTEVKKFKPVG